MTRQSLNETSSAWFHANPIDISTIHLVDPDQIDQEVFNQVHAIDSQSSSETITIETDSDTLKSDPEKTCTIQLVFQVLRTDRSLLVLLCLIFN